MFINDSLICGHILLIELTDSVYKNAKSVDFFLPTP